MPEVSEGSVAGWPSLILENESLRVTVLPAKGADVYELVHRPTGVCPRVDRRRFLGNESEGWKRGSTPAREGSL